jgi:hypothetical protein
MVPFAQATFSMMTGWPSDIRMRSVTMHPMVSFGPPAAKGTIIVIVRDGKTCAVAVLSGPKTAVNATPRASVRMSALPRAYSAATTTFSGRQSIGTWSGSAATRSSQVRIAG